MARDTIQITDESGFRAQLRQLRSHQDELEKLSSEKFTEAVAAAAAGRGGPSGVERLIGSIGAATGTSSGGVAAPVYAAAIEAVGETVTAIDEAIAAAKSSVAAAISDLQALVDGLGSAGIDGSGEAAIRQVSA